MLNLPVLAKKTKKEILDEYEKLLMKIDSAEHSAQSAFRQDNLNLIEKTKNFSLEAAHDSVAQIKGNINKGFSELSATLNEVLDSLENEITEKIKKFEELQQAIEASKQLLESQYNLSVSAEALKIIIAEHETKKQALEEEMRKLRMDSENETLTQKMNWAREQEEYEYQIKTAKMRNDAAVAEEKAKREKDWQERDNAWRQKEDEFNRLRAQVENIPAFLEKESDRKEKELRQALESENKNKLTQAQAEWEAKENLYKLKIENFENIIKKQDNEIVGLKKEQESASKKAQELAVKVIESGANKIGASDEPGN